MFEKVELEGRPSGIIRQITDDWKVFPPRELMRANGLLPNTSFTTIILDNGGIALIPVDIKNDKE